MNRCIHELFEERAALCPHAVAVVTGEGALTYGELNSRANRIAHYLIESGVRPDDLVALSLERSPALITALLGILKAGGAYVPLDQNYPKTRQEFMFHDTGAPFLLDSSWLATHSREIARKSAENPSSGATSHNLAYVMYTSGSTGNPKGVMIEHRSVVRLVKDTNYADLSAQEVILQLAPVSFDASTFEIWGALLNGGTLALMPPHTPSLDEIACAIRRFGATTMWLTAGLFHVMVDQNLEGLKPLRQLLAGGDVLSPSHVRRFLDATPGCKLINGYGPTEGTTFTCCQTLNGGDIFGESVPIGGPIANTYVYLLDARLQPVDPGTPGELYAGGLGVARGYRNQPELTAEKFIADPFSNDQTARLYKTGDLARQNAQGALEFLGRSDDQIKWNGFRIELGEIESVLNRHPAIRQAVVLARKDENAGERRLTAYLVPGSPSDVREFLARTLPGYMIPSAFVSMDALPLSPNGKVDRSALPAPPVVPVIERCAATSPVSETERAIAGVWSNVLGIERVGMDSNFFDLGGDSLQLIRAHAELNRVLGTDLPITDLFQYATVESLAQRVASKRDLPPVSGTDRERALKQRDAIARQKLARTGVFV